MKKLLRTIKICMQVVICIGIVSCNQDLSKYFINEGIALSKNETKRAWTVMIYMAADNNLEADAIRDINELESLPLQSMGVTVLCLLDRSVGYDGTNGNWEDTRLFEITKDEGGENGIIVSKELESTGLALTGDFATELDMANPNTLKNFLQFGYEHYAAEHYALIMYGHGNGWRSITSDTYTDTTMHLNDFSRALDYGLQGKVLDVLAFDSSFGSTMETLWEIKDYADWFAGTCKAMPTIGWNYKDIFSHFLQSEVSAKDFASAVQTQKESSIIALQYMSELKTSFDELMTLTASTIDTSEKQMAIKNVLLSGTMSYHASTYPSDMFLDVRDLAKKIGETATLLTSDDEVQNAIYAASSKVLHSLENALLQKSDGFASVSVFVISLKNEGVPDPIFPSQYIQGSALDNSISFVQESNGWAPTKSKNTSLLDIVFFTVF